MFETAPSNSTASPITFRNHCTNEPCTTRNVTTTVPNDLNWENPSRPIPRL